MHLFVNIQLVTACAHTAGLVELRHARRGSLGGLDVCAPDQTWGGGLGLVVREPAILAVVLECSIGNKFLLALALVVLGPLTVVRFDVPLEVRLSSECCVTLVADVRLAESITDDSDARHRRGEAF